MRIVIPGGSGQVGTMLARSFRAAGHEVVVLGRQPFVAPWRVVFRDARTAGLWERELEIGTRLLGTESELVLKSRRVIPSRLPRIRLCVRVSGMERRRRGAYSTR